MLLKLLIVLGPVLLNSLAFGGHKVYMDEVFLKKMAQQGAPQLDQISAAFLSTKLAASEEQDQFNPQLFGQASYAETNELPILQFMPVWTPLKRAQLGVRQDLKHGLSWEAALQADQRSALTRNSKFENITTTSLAFSMQLDLWRDLFGRLSQAGLENAELELKKAEMEREIKTKTFFISLRKIYWQLVANNEAIKIAQELLKTSQKQLQDSQNRFKNAITEADEVARNQAQVATRKSTLYYLNYQKEVYLKQLKVLLPDLTDSEIIIGQYDIGETFNQVKVCTGTIAQELTPPYQYTYYDEMNGYLKKIKSNHSLINSYYSDPDLKLFGTLKSTGVGSHESGSSLNRGSYGAAFNDMHEANRTGYEIGLRVTIPLGDSKKLSQKTKELYDEKRLMAAINASDAQVNNTHQQLVKTIAMLTEVIKVQKITSTQLKKRLEIMEKKYQQARASINDLIQDQDALLNSELTLIDTQSQVLGILFEYLAIYTETPCSFNRI